EASSTATPTAATPTAVPATATSTRRRCPRGRSRRGFRRCRNAADEAAAIPQGFARQLATVGVEGQGEGADLAPGERDVDSLVSRGRPFGAKHNAHLGTGRGTEVQAYLDIL